MFRLKMALKAALIPVIVGLVILITGIALILAGVFVDSSNSGTLLITGIIVTVSSIGAFIFAYAQAKSRLHAICPECQKFMGDTNSTINYSFVCNQYKENYDQNTNKFRDFTFYYTCKIVCPHCGGSHMFDYKTNAKTEPKANEAVNNYLKGILKLKK